MEPFRKVWDGFIFSSMLTLVFEAQIPADMSVVDEVTMFLCTLEDPLDA